ncbi:MAG: aminopeptidase P family protein [Acidimicrobiales bacterium]
MTELVPVLVADRLVKLRARLDQDSLDAALITTLTNVRYLTGFTGSFAALLVTSDEAFLLTDGRYREQAPLQTQAAGIECQLALVTATASIASLLQERLGDGWSVGFEAGNITWEQHRGLAEVLPQKLLPTTNLVEDLRLVKDDGEVCRIEQACAIADEALGEVVALMNESPSEQRFGLELDTAMRRLGAAERSFETIVASGPNSALPHARPSQRAIGSGDLVVVDFGALLDGYHSDMTRTFSIGRIAGERRELFDLVATAQAAGCEAVAPGVAASHIDEVCRTVIADAGYGDAFMHGTGHGVGLDIHEAPAVSRTSKSILEPGYVITVEPGVYLPDVGGVRIEDTVVVTGDGYRALTNYSKSPKPVQ